ncbi:GNAT family N-acetyltransferase [Phaeodactylibacter luteus]|uniref:GNAT family N-acetyltransferase n=1 Tax=Phaeodactylibacter luteus TaxID=1564516 RepID=A0A5C6RSG6_9BACT|nr:GNAT family N-acetyltransferase [Phaeodactylibacter luteus]TXB64884.1 GNAT family N-acetyltransferase [Phaeodactylibacter luteus]
MIANEQIRTLAFDADDTLWVNEPIFRHTEQRLKDLLLDYVGDIDFDQRIYEVERRNLSLFGYGVKGFTLSMMETALELAGKALPAAAVASILQMGKDMISYPIEVLDGVEEVLKALQPHYNLIIITKGDLFDQESKVARSGLAGYFTHVEVVSEKNRTAYKEVFQRLGIAPAEVLMIGNSVKSDVLPVIDAGGQAVHIPFHTTWQHEEVNTDILMEYAFPVLEDIRRLPRLLNPTERPAYAAGATILYGSRFRLRPLRPGDEESLSRLANNPKIARNLMDRFPQPYTRADAARFITFARQSGEEAVFGIEVEGQVSGVISLLFKEDVYRASVELGYWLGEPFWGQGISTEAVKLVTAYALEKAEVSRVFANVFEYNPASRRVLEKAGFEKEGVSRRAARKNGQLLDVHVYARYST